MTILVYGIPAVTNSHVFTVNAHDVSGSLNSWGWITLIIDVCGCWRPGADGQSGGALVCRGGARA